MFVSFDHELLQENSLRYWRLVEVLNTILNVLT